MINTLELINKQAKTNTMQFISDCEREYNDRIDALAKTIADNNDIKIVAIAGPSGSGKTTTAHLLCERLHMYDEETAVVSLDDFYLPYAELPQLPDGSLDIESVNALDTDLIKQCFDDIIKRGETNLPKYDFKTRARNEETTHVDIGERGIVIVEGLHAMNPAIADLVDRKNIFKIYISVNTPVEFENGEQLLSSRQIRLIRRILRDDRFRGTTPDDTLKLWNNVIEGEAKYLYCFKGNADVRLITLHPYELCVYRERFCRLRNKVNRNTPCYEYFIKTANALERFTDIDSSLVPSDALIREFLGN